VSETLGLASFLHYSICSMHIFNGETYSFIELAKCHNWVVSVSVSYLGVPRFKFLLESWLFWQMFCGCGFPQSH